MFPLSFAAPLLLLGLLALPLLWWLLRATPPAPQERAFGGLFFLRQLRDDSAEPARTPWPVLLIRLLAAASLILALAGPVLNAPEEAAAQAPLLVVVDDGWTAAPAWPDLQDALAEEAARPGAERRAAFLLRTAGDPAVIEGPFSVEEAARRLRAAVPSPRLPDYAQAAEALRQTPPAAQAVLWLMGDAAAEDRDRPAFARMLFETGPVTVFRRPGRTVTAITALDGSGAAMTAQLSRGGGALPEQDGRLRAMAKDGRTLAVVPFAFGQGETVTEAVIGLPLALRNQALTLSIAGERSAGATYLIDASSRRVRAGIVGTPGDGSLVSSGTYLDAALGPAALIERGTVAELADDATGLIILDDVGTLRPADEARLASWLAGGGVLLRFAGPDTAASPLARGDTFTGPLRQGGRSVGGALTWETPQNIAGFAEDGPLAGLPVPEDVLVRRQVLLEGGSDAAVWAYLEDGTPLVTARPVGDGLTVLFHVTASPSWSDLPLSGSFSAMLRRVLTLAGRSAPGAAQEGGPLEAIRVLNGRGELVEPSTAIPALSEETLEAGAVLPGLYGTFDAPVAVNAYDGTPALIPPARGLPTGVTVTGPTGPKVQRLGPALLAAALILFALDAFIVAWLSGGRRALPAAAALVVLMALPPAGDAAAQDRPRPPLGDKAVSAALETRFAYVRTGDSRMDRVSEAGLFGLTREAIRRSALEPAMPIGVDLERDDLSVFPLLYWPIVENGREPSDAALAKVERFMAGGGLVIIDTMDGERAAAGGQTPQRDRLRAVLGRMDTPPLQPMPAGHILTKSFYRIDDLHGRNSGGPVWVEAPGALEENKDSVPSLILGGRDWASAWAVDEGGVPLRPGSAAQRERAYRAGVNMAMVALTGNYKGDQIHVQELLDRLGPQESPFP